MIGAVRALQTRDVPLLQKCLPQSIEDQRFAHLEDAFYGGRLEEEVRPRVRQQLPPDSSPRYNMLASALEGPSLAHTDNIQDWEGVCLEELQVSFY